MQIVLYAPEIPPNTGSIARLCAATGTRLNLIEPLGFSLDDRYLRRAGLDYWPSVDVKVWPDWETFATSSTSATAETAEAGAGPGRLVLASARQGEPYHRFRFSPGDRLVLGPESTGLPPDILARYPDHVRIPIWGAVRSLNLANAASILLYEAFRQTGALDGK